MESSNKGIYIFWGLILLVVVGVVLFFVIPRTDYALAYKSYASVSNNTHEEITEDKTYYDYINSAKSKFGAIAGVEEGINTLTSLAVIQDTFALAEDYTKTSLTFVNKNGKYMNAAKTLDKAGKSLNKKINNFQEYCTDILASALAQNHLPTSEINFTVSGLNQRYTELLAAYVGYYEKAAALIENHAIKNMENNPTVINAHKAIILDIKTELAKDDISMSAVSSIHATATSVYSSIYYITHF